MLKILIDPGHRKGYNPGVVTGYYEGTTVWNLSMHLKTELDKYEGVMVQLTRPTLQDDIPNIENRGKMAIDLGVDVFLSMHTDGIKNVPNAEKACGVTTFSSVRRPQAAILAQELGKAVANEMKKHTGVTYYRGNLKKPYSPKSTFDWLGVLRGATRSGSVKYPILIEHGFHTNLKECTYMSQDSNLKTIAEVEAKVIADFFKLKKKTNVIVTPQEKEIVLIKSINGYYSAADAMAGINSKVTMPAGSYRIFRTFKNGAINITKDKTGSTPGAWINPNDNIEDPKPEPKEPEIPKEDTSKLTMITLFPGNTPVVTEKKVIDYIRKNATKGLRINGSLEALVHDYATIGYRERIRWDIAICQAILETGFFSYGNQVNADQNNFAGIGATDNGAAGNMFKTPLEGVTAHIQHLKAYANEYPLNTELVDPRFNYVPRGYSPYVEWLGSPDNPKNKVSGKTVGWASAQGYGDKILSVLNNIVNS